MISKILLSMVIFASVFYSIGCCWSSCRWVDGATYQVTYEDGTTQDIVAEGTSGNACIDYDCSRGEPTNVQIQINSQA